jgi:hypothetical protein
MIMPTFEELKAQLNSSDWKERRNAAKALGSVTGEHREEAIRALKDRLCVDDDDDVIETIVDTLQQMKALDEEVFETLKSRVSENLTPVRRAAVKCLTTFLTKFQGRLQEVVPLLKQRLEVEDDSYIIEVIVKTLEQTKTLDDKVFEILINRISEDSMWVRRAVIECLSKFQEHFQEVVPLLKQRLEVENERYVIKAIIDVLHEKAGMTVEQMSRILSRNPHLLRWSHDDWHNLWHLGGVVRQVIEHTLYQRWWRLPREVRRQFDWPWLWLWPWRHWHPFYEELWHRLERLLEERGRRDEAEWLIASMRLWWGSPWWYFARHDFEALMSLRVEQHVTYEEQNVLRFRYLDAFATDHQGRPLRDWVRQFQQNWDEFLQIEEQFDRVRDEISDLHRQQEEIIREAERRHEGEWRWERGEPPRLPQDLQRRWDEVAERLRRLEGDEEPGELQRLHRALEEASQRLMPHLRERGVRFRVIEVEGVLGEYNFYERKVTLYPLMIELVAKDLAPALGRSTEDVYNDLYTITEMHETAHATTHLGIDSDGTLWERPEQGTSELHETLAQFYTFQLLRSLKESHLEQVFLELNKRQPERYRFWQVLQGVPLELARQFLIDKRAGRFQEDLLSLAQEAAKVVGRAMPLLRTVLSDREFRAFEDGLKVVIGKMEAAGTRWELSKAAAEFLDLCERYPFVHSLLEHAFPHGFPSPVQRQLLLASSLVGGEPIKASTLRLTIDQIKNACIAALMQNDLIVRNEIIHGLRAALELQELVQPKERAKKRGKRK